VDKGSPEKKGNGTIRGKSCGRVKDISGDPVRTPPTYNVKRGLTTLISKAFMCNLDLESGWTKDKEIEKLPVVPGRAGTARRKHCEVLRGGITRPFIVGKRHKGGEGRKSGPNTDNLADRPPCVRAWGGLGQGGSGDKRTEQVSGRPDTG